MRKFLKIETDFHLQSGIRLRTWATQRFRAGGICWVTLLACCNRLLAYGPSLLAMGSSWLPRTKPIPSTPARTLVPGKIMDHSSAATKAAITQRAVANSFNKLWILISSARYFSFHSMHSFFAYEATI